MTAIWLLPFYPSPLRDDGYDIADYASVHPSYGDLEDFKRFVDAAHERGIRVITELVINHTSDAHPWFQRARRRPRARPSATSMSGAIRRTTIRARASSSSIRRPRTGRGTRWPRPTSGTASIRTSRTSTSTIRACSTRSCAAMRFWLDLGVDGLRLDAVPYLCERDGTNNENLPETHDVLRRIRAEIDAQLSRPHAARRGQPVAGGHAALFRRWRRMPHGVPLPAHAAHVHGAWRRRTATRSPTSAADTGNARRLPVGAVPAQPRRADAGDGDGRGARLPVEDVCRRSAGAHQSRHPPPPRVADGQRPAQDRADERPAVVDAAARRSSITATRSAWATTSTSAIAMACARRCSGRSTATPAFRAPIRSGCTCRC